MALPNIFDSTISGNIIQRIEKLTPTSKPTWGKMEVAEMLAHCNVTYELVYEDKHAKPNGIMKFILKTFIKKTVVSEAGYKKNSGTGPQFLIKDKRDFATEKARLIAFITKTQQLGASHFEGKESNSFGALTSTEWNNLFYKHLDHHLSQFGV